VIVAGLLTEYWVKAPTAIPSEAAGSDNTPAGMAVERSV
jgi:hypothetical protein